MMNSVRGMWRIQKQKQNINEIIEEENEEKKKTQLPTVTRPIWPDAPRNLWNCINLKHKKKINNKQQMKIHMLECKTKYIYK